MEHKKKTSERKRRIQEMFNAIARRYDLLNHLLSGGMDLYWRRRALSEVRRRPRWVLDLATGTGDFALAALRLGPGRVVGVDVALKMVELGVRKVRRSPGAPVHLMGGDAEGLPFCEACFDLVAVAFGVRNFGDIPTGLREAWRVLRPGGEVLVLEFSAPQAPFFRHLYGFYFTRILPLIGGAISGNRPAYRYLPQSVGGFAQGGAFLELLAEAGFVERAQTRLSLGIASVYQGRKPEVVDAGERG